MPKIAKLEMIRLLYGDPMQVFSDLIRSTIIAPPGKVLDCADFNAIETRVLFWVAHHEDGLDAFRNGRDLYKEMAATLFHKSVDKIGKDSYERFIGKGLILGCGYAMGGKKFARTCAMQGQAVDEDFAKTAVNAYRTVHRPVVKLWENIERAAVAAVENVGKKYSINHTSWFVQGKFLYCQLPSGRRLAYYAPSVAYEPTPWGEKKAALYHYGVGFNKKWMNDKTYGGKLTENVVQAIARDIMAEAMLRIEATKSWEIVLSVHDELVAERETGMLMSQVTNEKFCKLMAEPPHWCDDCPIAVEGWSGTRYRK